MLNFLVFQLKHYKMEVFEIFLLLLFYSKTHFYNFILITYKNAQFGFYNKNDDKNNKDDYKKWPYKC